jgi:hypothetical protein
MSVLSASNKKMLEGRIPAKLIRDAVFVLFTGARGSGKTLLMTGLQIIDLIKYYYIYQATGELWRVWSNYPVGFWLFDPVLNKQVYLCPLPLNMEALYLFDQEMVKGKAYIDEIDLWYDRQDWMSVTQKLLSAGLQQIRKRHFSIIGSIQDINWLNARGQFQVDVQAKCRDSAFTPWGRGRNLSMGSIINLQFLDKSGFQTGYSFLEYPRTFDWQFWAEWVHDKYDTEYQFDVLASKTRYSLKVDHKTIDLTGQDDPQFKTAMRERDLAIVSDVLRELIDSGKTRVTKTEVLDEVEERGISLPRNRIRSLYMRLGATEGGGGNMYLNLEEVKS